MVGTLEEGLREVTRRRSVTAGLDEYDRELVGGSVRLDLPFADPVAMRRIGELLCGLGERLKHYSARGDLTEFAILMALKGEALTTRRRILEAAGKKARGTKLLDGDDAPK